MYSRMPTRNDAIHGHIEYNHVLQELWPLQSLQQLTEKKQLGLVLKLYPCAEHSRFVHSIGTGHVARLMGQSTNKLSKKELDYLQVAGTLHDITHYPFSHAPERAIPISHDAAMEYVLRDQRNFGAINADELHTALRRLDIDPLRLLRIFQGDRTDVLSQFITNKVVDADKLDYIPRDLHMADLGMVETKYIIREMVLREGRLGIRNGATTNLTTLISNRVHGFDRMYAHYKVHAGETMLVYAIQQDPWFAELKGAPEEDQFTACSALHGMTERELLRRLSTSGDPLVAKLSKPLLGSAESWYKAVAAVGHESNVGVLEELVAHEDAIRAECLEQGMLCSGFQARRALKTRHEELPQFLVLKDETEEDFLRREEQARAAYQHIPGYAFVIYAEERTTKAIRRAEAIVKKYSKGASTPQLSLALL